MGHSKNRGRRRLTLPLPLSGRRRFEWGCLAEATHARSEEPFDEHPPQTAG